HAVVYGKRVGVVGEAGGAVEPGGEGVLAVQVVPERRWRQVALRVVAPAYDHEDIGAAPIRGRLLVFQACDAWGECELVGGRIGLQPAQQRGTPEVVGRLEAGRRPGHA